ncbi:MAG: SCO family protein [Candidatus Neomarinimicrobiota bacterium]|nr:MAG: SCO family protein [bacterium]|tara:strand:- start:5232 stop:5825 length:594 start_codon:yes stop_codon:yes gene_type:complete
MSDLNKKLIIAFFSVFILGIVGLFTIDQATQSRINNLPLITEIPSFQLENFDGTSFTEQNLDNQITVASFIFTQCEGACPIMSENMGLLQKRFAESNELQFVSITTDPDYDSKDILQEFSNKYSNKNNWFFLRGNIDEVVELSQDGFFLSASLLPLGHSTRLILIDKDRNIRKYYEGTIDANIVELQNDIVTLIKQG